MSNAHAPEREEDALFEQSRRVREDAAKLRRSLGDLVEGSEARLRDELEHRPYLTLSLAAGAGYVLGGGLPPRVARLMLEIGGRLLVTSILRDLVTGNPERRTS